MRCKDVVDFLQHIRNRVVHRLIDRRFEVAPECIEQLFVVCLACADVIELFFKRRGVVIAYVFAEVICQKRSDQAAFVLGEKAVLVFAHVFAVLNGCHDRRVC